MTAHCLPIALDNFPVGRYNETTGGGAHMKVEFTFDKEQIQQYGYTVEAVRQTIQKSFAAKGLHCISNGERLSFAGCGGEEDFSNMWAILMALLRTDWFPKFAASCTWHDDDGTQEDVLSQAWKIQRRKMA